MWNLQRDVDAAGAAGRLAGWWRQALLKGLPQADKIDVQVAYYADLLRRDSGQQGEYEHGDVPMDDLVVAWAAQLGAPAEVASGWLTAPLRSAIGWVAHQYGLDHALLEKFVRAFFGELHRYFADPDARAAVVDRVVEQLHRNRPHVVIAHSLGSVVAYEALTRAATPRIELLLTLGSPLAMPGLVFERLATGIAGPVVPEAVGRWINIADVGDVIAVPVGGVGRSFSGLDADLTETIGAFDFHRVAGYLACGATSGVLAGRLPRAQKPRGT